MKQYYTLGELLIDYRADSNLSQAEFATMMNVDTRTLQRWEKNVTLIHANKVEEVITETLLPYQLVHNLNASVVIPTYYDFKIRKYSLNELTTELPKADWFRDQIKIKTARLRPIDFNFDLKYIKRFIDSQKKDDTYVNDGLIEEAIRLLPELNVILTEESGYYSGYSIILPIKESVYLKLKNKEISNKDLRRSDLTNNKLENRPIFYNYDTTVDSNDGAFYILASFLRFFRDLKNRDYLFCTYSERDDGFKLNQQVGLKVVWEDLELQKELGSNFPPRFMEGNYKEFLKSL